MSPRRPGPCRRFHPSAWRSPLCSPNPTFPARRSQRSHAALLTRTPRCCHPFGRPPDAPRPTARPRPARNTGGLTQQQPPAPATPVRAPACGAFGLPCRRPAQPVPDVALREPVRPGCHARHRRRGPGPPRSSNPLAPGPTLGACYHTAAGLSILLTSVSFRLHCTPRCPGPSLRLHAALAARFTRLPRPRAPAPACTQSRHNGSAPSRRRAYKPGNTPRAPPAPGPTGAGPRPA